ncbi:16S rRNA (cytidine(1402)-2'-O)-methyltransferase [Streptomyces alkaliphilus]|uniref:16S rRNA (cytidine(1402)-2'-O)-methyltransferase n=1 Tax=Streptomyces alkaliphilus TaxID=1472722 RepID=UPI001E37B0F0|nr:16S rRNA (cytidine(1402)-2'-O)-methyltransferase [Streptomyces alkaliphilus]
MTDVTEEERDVRAGTVRDGDEGGRERYDTGDGAGASGPFDGSAEAPWDAEGPEPEPEREPGPEPEGGLLVLAGTPIGDPDDAPPRLAAELARADVVAAEDTRRLRRLTRDLDVRITGRVVSYFEGNEAARTPELVEELVAGARVLLVTDAGMPSVSDPGYRLVAGAVARGVRVTAVPGPSAVLTALAVSGLPVDRFCFEGFPPRRPGERLARLRESAGETRTMVFFEAPHRLAATLAAMAEAYGPDREAAVCRELTKTWEEVLRGTLGELAARAEKGVRGEITIVVRGADPSSAPPPDPAELARRVAALEAGGTRRKEAIAEVAKAAGRPKREVFDAVVAAKRDGHTGEERGETGR